MTDTNSQPDYAEAFRRGLSGTETPIRPTQLTARDFYSKENLPMMLDDDRGVEPPLDFKLPRITG